MKKIIFIFEMAIVMVVLLSLQPISAQQIKITDLGTLGGDISQAYGINSRGQVVGSSRTTEGFQHAFLWTKRDGMMDLGTLGGENSFAHGINSRGQVVGWSLTAEGFQHAFLWTARDGMVDLGTLGGDVESGASGINSRGQVVGTSITAEGFYHAFLWTARDGMMDLGTLGFEFSEAYGINSKAHRRCRRPSSPILRGQVVGWSLTAECFQHAFLWTARDGMTDLGTLGGNSSVARGINSRGQVVGYSRTTEGFQHAFLWTARDGMMDLGTLGGDESFAYGINSRGQVVGSSITAEGFQHAFLWTARDGMTDLETLGGDHSWARGINSRGQVVGFRSGHAALWTVENPTQMCLGKAQNEFETKFLPPNNSQLPETFLLHQNYPNPFNPATRIQFSLPEDSDVLLEIYNSTGQKIETLMNTRLGSGYYNVNWDASNIPSGIYFYKIKAGSFQDLKKMILVK